MKKLFMSLMVVCFVFCAQTFALNTSWNALGDGVSWTDGDNWSLDVIPTSADAVYINGAAAAAHNVTIDSSVSAVCSKIRVAKVDVATLDILSGATLTTAIAVRLSEGGAGNGTINMYGAALGGGNTAFQVAYSTGATGTMNQYAGTVTGGNFLMAYGSGSTGTYNLHDGIVNVGTTQIGRTGNGALNMYGGSINATGFQIAPNSGSTGHVQLDAGTITATNLSFGLGTASMDIKDGMMVINFTVEEGGETWEDFKVRLEGLGITGYGSTSNVVYEYQDRGGYVATITAIPEPCTIALLAIGSLSVLRRKQN